MERLFKLVSYLKVAEGNTYKHLSWFCIGTHWATVQEQLMYVPNVLVLVNAKPKNTTKSQVQTLRIPLSLTYVNI